MNKHIDALFVPYALGILAQEERRLVEEYVAGDRDAEERLAHILNETYSTYSGEALEIPPLAPAVATRAALFARVNEDLAARRTTTEHAPPVTGTIRTSTASPAAPGRRSFWSWLTSRGGAPVLAFSAAGFIVVFMLGLWINNLNDRLVRQEQALAALTSERDTQGAELAELRGEVTALQADNDSLAQTRAELEQRVNALRDNNESLLAEVRAQEEVTALFGSPHVHTVALEATDVTPAASGQLIVDPQQSVALLIISDLPPLEEGLAYQVLLIYGDAHETGETFRVNTAGQDVVVIRADRPMIGFDHIGISVEPAGGSIQRTGDVVLLAALPQS